MLFVRFFYCLAGFSVLSACNSEEIRSSKYQGNMVLALSWQTAFCETRPRLPECRSQTKGRFDADHFSLHGLWPQPGSNIYCDVSQQVINTDKQRRWRKLQGLGLSESLKKRLWKIMPGARSFLHRHEWVKHGTCYSNDPESYFEDSLFVTEAINQSPVRDLFAQNIDRKINAVQIRAAFDKAFGKGAGDRVRVSCKRDGGRVLITEITIGLSGLITPEANVGDLIRQSPTTKRGCIAGIVDRAGFQ